MIGWSAGALWRRRWVVLGLTVGWLMLDGLVLKYGLDFLPQLRLQVPLEVLDHPSDLTLHLYGAVIRTLQTLPRELLRDVLRAVFAVLILRTLLVSSPEPSRP